MKFTSASLQAPPGLKERTLLEVGLIDGFVVVPSPVGDLAVAFNPRGVSAVAPSDTAFPEAFGRRFGRQTLPVEQLPEPLNTRVLRALETGKAAQVPIDWRGQTTFQQEVLAAATLIPPGEVRPYGWVANRIGHPGAVRAVGSALGQNPVPILVACHRVVRADGTLGQYRFGPAMKGALLAAEGLSFDSARGALVGNIATATVCYPSCQIGRRIAGDRQRWFSSARQASEAGFGPCERCQPVLASP